MPAFDRDASFPVLAWLVMDDTTDRTGQTSSIYRLYCPMVLDVLESRASAGREKKNIDNSPMRFRTNDEESSLGLLGTAARILVAVRFGSVNTAAGFVNCHRRSRRLRTRKHIYEEVRFGKQVGYNVPNASIS